MLAVLAVQARVSAQEALEQLTYRVRPLFIASHDTSYRFRQTCPTYSKQPRGALIYSKFVNATCYAHASSLVEVSEALVFTAACRYLRMRISMPNYMRPHSRRQARIISVTITASHGDQSNTRGKPSCIRWCPELHSSLQARKYKMDVKHALRILSTAKQPNPVNTQQ